MAVVHVSLQELKRAYRNHIQAYEACPRPTNAHRLLLFYAIECGLKAVLLKRKNCKSTDELSDDVKLDHDLNKLLSELKTGRTLNIPNNIKIQAKPPRQPIMISELHQVWRYGGKATDPPDDQLEQKLLKVINWIDQNIQGK